MCTRFAVSANLLVPHLYSPMAAAVASKPMFAITITHTITPPKAKTGLREDPAR